MKRAKGRTGGCEADSMNMAHVLMLLSQNGTGSSNLVQYYPVHEERVFECKTCKRQFPSFQALGGHRARHKKHRTDLVECTNQAGGAFAKPKLHECSICGLEYATGQALGGHMRRHRQVATEGFSVHNGILETNKSCDESNRGIQRVQWHLFDVECEKDREPVTLNLFL